MAKKKKIKFTKRDEMKFEKFIDALSDDDLCDILSEGKGKIIQFFNGLLKKKLK